ncbi:zinc finger protein [Macleaya cordata]|uniref:Zinc finger protein n=1 Tax=Macleaya cordata TaxID=56857 RepID=A0A200PTY2_MACCD|nr:zinc finger protein [Macleaya cordata]
MVRRKDHFWEYAEELKGRFRCKFCHKDYPGGIARVKSHLSRQPGRDIAICNSVPDDVQALAFIAVRGKDFPYKKRKAVTFSTNMEGNGVESSLSPITSCPDSSMALQQTPLPAVCNKKDKELVDKMVAQAFIMNNIPFDVIQSSSFVSMVKAVAEFGTGYSLPSYTTLCTKLVRDARNNVEEYVSAVKETWSLTGCTLMPDIWTDSKNCSFINIVAYSPKGAVFLKSFERSEQKKIELFLGDMLVSVIDEIGPENVVQIVVNSASYYEYDNDLIMRRYPHIYKTQCAANEIQVLLKDFYKEVEWIQSVLDDAKMIMDYMYKYSDVLKLTRVHTGDKELKRPCRTRFSSHFTMLQSFLEVEANLHLMVVSPEWIDLNHNKTTMGEKVTQTLQSVTFWSRVKEVVLVLEPLIKALCLVEGEGSTAGYLYEAIEKVKMELKQRFSADALKYLKLWELFNSRWCGTVVHKIHAAAAFLNPLLMYDGKIKYEQPDIRDGMNYVAESLVGMKEMDDFAAQLLLYNGKSPKLFNTLSVLMMKKAHPHKFAINLEKLEELPDDIDDHCEEIENKEGFTDTATFAIDDMLGSPSQLSSNVI